MSILLPLLHLEAEVYLSYAALVSDATVPEIQPEESRRRAMARVLARPSLGVAGDFANELAARIG